MRTGRAQCDKDAGQTWTGRGQRRLSQGPAVLRATFPPTTPPRSVPGALSTSGCPGLGADTGVAKALARRAELVCSLSLPTPGDAFVLQDLLSPQQMRGGTPEGSGRTSCARPRLCGCVCPLVFRSGIPRAGGRRRVTVEPCAFQRPHQGCSHPGNAITVRVAGFVCKSDVTIFPALPLWQLQYRHQAQGNPKLTALQALSGAGSWAGKLLAELPAPGRD
eukprot:gene12708-biopygen21497